MILSIRWLIVLLVGAALAPSDARAQSVARSFGELQGLVRPGETVVVTDENGRELKGKLGEISASSLALLTIGGMGDGRGSQQASPREQRLSEGAVREIRRLDGLRNGMLIGLAVGAVPTVLSGIVLGSHCANEGGDCASALLLISGLYR